MQVKDDGRGAQLGEGRVHRGPETGVDVRLDTDHARGLSVRNEVALACAVQSDMCGGGHGE
ncbi:hypothetical protein GCM10009850_027470 [Nonomuraea monospora]|uniref:Uncharacterized protein n=1 Tax=Nonomuraea monospora TaxID=568818 RepID=A0ABP5P6C8_9ACTN